MTIFYIEGPHVIVSLHTYSRGGNLAFGTTFQWHGVYKRARENAASQVPRDSDTLRAHDMGCVVWGKPCKVLFVYTNLALD